MPFQFTIKNNKNTALFLGIVAALFFASTFVLNRVMAVSGGSWQWTASLRFIWMLPILFVIVFIRGNLAPLFEAIKSNIPQWLLWSTIGFGVFYATLTFGASFGPSWLVASTFEFTIIAGMFIGPLLEKKENRSGISKASLLFSITIFLGIVLMQISEARASSIKSMLLGTIPVLIGAIAYPLGNRKMMQIAENKLDAFQRTLGMTLCSMPFWILLSIFGYMDSGLPTESQLLQTFMVAIFSGIIATLLFFTATDLVRTDHKALAAIEATQAMEVIFTLLGEIILLQAAFPNSYSCVGIALVVIGMILHSRAN
ncbi:multidrug resistance efflux transporter family protein [Sphingobacterium sp. ML3W]|uniref:DMT family transporter n=1 Tax=Sphingobacterium sp. ML3W TaxID=1538644 RepID=UPI00249B9975|nr:multidrug resistance efflux transporter family protein [Sphingobacterium sp. ML3W]WFA81268.1 multidrug resistance efflux transporter family protein [Sphingobacterium sp. ML3W]